MEESLAKFSLSVGFDYLRVSHEVLGGLPDNPGGAGKLQEAPTSIPVGRGSAPRHQTHVDFNVFLCLHLNAVIRTPLLIRIVLIL